ncbi:MAG: hypothetical protein H7Y16_00590 [Candidatus Parcubacteria bacterium]|nr:hypothetical protein [Burkholderiales bacterium]
MSSSAEQHTLYQIANAPLREHPYPHILVHEVFEPDLYRRMQENLLPPELMRPIKEERAVGKAYSDDRHVFTLAKDKIGALPQPHRAFWDELTGWLLNAPFAVTLFNKFGRHIHERFGDPQPPFYNEALLVDDRVRYSLGPHSDTPSKVITLLFYLPADDSRSHLGTSIYTPRDPSFRCPGGPHYPFDLFDRVVTMPYVSNTLFAFVKTDNSFHGVEPIRDKDYRRHLLLYDVKCRTEDLPPAPAAASSSRVEFTF